MLQTGRRDVQFTDDTLQSLDTEVEVFQTDTSSELSAHTIL